MRKLRRGAVVVGMAFSLLMTGVSGAAPASGPAGYDAGQHGPQEGHLVGPGESGSVDLIGKLRIGGVQPGLISDVTVFGNYAYLGRYASAACEGPEGGGRDGGVYVVDISNLANPVEVGFIPAHQDTYVSEGVQVVHVTTGRFTGDVLVQNNEGCGKNYKAGVSLWDVTDPTKPKKLSQNFGDFTVDGEPNRPHDANQVHSAFLWDAGNRAYMVSVDDEESGGDDVDIFDVTDPKHPVLIAEHSLAGLFPQILQTDPNLGLNEVFLHDMTVKAVNGRFLMLLSYWDAGYVVLDVTDPRSPVLVADSDFNNPDPEAAESGFLVPPAGNAHQAEFTLDNGHIIGTDEDFDPVSAEITTEEGAVILATSGSDTPFIQGTLTGDTVFVGRACPGDPAVPAAPATATGVQIAVVERGVCLFNQKLTAVEAAGGYEAVIFFNREGADACSSGFRMLVEGDLPTLAVPRDVGYGFFGLDGAYDEAACLQATAGANQAPIPLGAVGERVSARAYFDGWGYVHLFANNTGKLTELDTYAVPEAHDPAYATGFGDLSVHEVATSQVDPTIAYLAYYAAGFRVVQIREGELVEIGAYLAPEGNNFWGVEVFQRDGVEYVAASDRDYGLYIFRSRPPTP